MESIIRINDAVNSFAWGWFGLILLLGTGLVCTVITKFFQITHIKHWWSKTIGMVLNKDSHVKTEQGSASKCFPLSSCGCFFPPFHMQERYFGYNK